jgi:hypothetical protein
VTTPTRGRDLQCEEKWGRRCRQSRQAITDDQLVDMDVDIGDLAGTLVASATSWLPS